ncbi:MAG: hypothetical protein Aurels2KO_49840 [Aureliella sp.]
MLFLLSVTGCGGCRRTLTDEELAKKKTDEKALEIYEMQALPIDQEQAIMTAKPGHWYETRQEFKSNREDLQVVVEGTIRRGNEAVAVPGTDVLNTYTRRSSLPRGQTRSIELQVFVPPAAVSVNEDAFAFESTALKFQTQLLSYPLMTPLLSAPESKPARELKPHEYQLVVLSPEAQSYAFLASLDTVLWRADELMAIERTRSYYVSLLKPRADRYPLPKSMLTMTATAAIVWDDVDEDSLSAAQKQALMDWVHWGGQLVISGPNSWTRLRDSFLSDLLPVSDAKSVKLDTSSFDAISDTWVVKDLARGQEPRLTIDGAAISGMQFELAPGGAWLPNTDELVAERQVGRGRIVMTAFPLREPKIFNWRYFSSFFSSGILRRPPRMAGRHPTENMLTQFWAGDLRGAETESRLNTRLRILSRDLPLGNVNRTNKRTNNNSSQAPDTAPQSNSSRDSNPEIDNPEIDKESDLAEVASAPALPIDSQLNLPDSNRPGRELLAWGANSGAWNDYSAVAYQAVASLSDAAGIELPSRRTILYLLGGYLLILVPLNWAFFKAIGRLEYAWIAAPILAVAGVIAVTRIARLDIGFARRSTEISILELHDGHARGHLTQYVALYTSLSTNYSVQIPENGSVALPLGELNSSSRRTSNLAEMKTNFGRSEGVTISPFTVLSNSTERVHAEQMVSLDGGLSLGTRENGASAIRNDTGAELVAALVVRRDDQGAIEYATIDELQSGQIATVTFAPASRDSLWQSWESDPVTQSLAPPQEEMLAADEPLWLGGLMKSIVQKTPLIRGQVLLVGYTRDSIGELALTPDQDQYDRRCVVVAHLKPGNLQPVIPDRSILSAIRPRDAGPSPTQ